MKRMRDRGFTLIELLLSIIIISAGLLGIMSLFENATRGALQADMNVIALNLIHEKLEQIVTRKAINGYDAITSYSDESFTGDYSVYTRHTEVKEVSSADFVTLLAGSGYKRIDVTVSWGTGAGKSITVPTVLSLY